MANDVVELIIAGRIAGQFWESVRHWQANIDTGPNPVGLATNMITAFQTDIQDAFLECCAADVDIYGYKCKRVNNGGGPYVMVPITPVAGVVGGTSATSATCGVVLTSYQHMSKWHTGRWFLPGIPEQELTGNNFSANYISAVNALISAASSVTSGGNSFASGVWSRKYDTFFTGAFNGLSQKPGIQRRRLLPTL